MYKPLIQKPFFYVYSIPFRFITEWTFSLYICKSFYQISEMLSQKLNKFQIKTVAFSDETQAFEIHSKHPL